MQKDKHKRNEKQQSKAADTYVYVAKTNVT